MNDISDSVTFSPEIAPPTKLVDDELKAVASDTFGVAAVSVSNETLNAVVVSLIGAAVDTVKHIVATLEPLDAYAVLPVGL